MRISVDHFSSGVSGVLTLLVGGRGTLRVGASNCFGRVGSVLPGTRVITECGRLKNGCVALNSSSRCCSGVKVKVRRNLSTTGGYNFRCFAMCEGEEPCLVPVRWLGLGEKGDVSRGLLELLRRGTELDGGRLTTTLNISRRRITSRVGLLRGANIVGTCGTFVSARGASGRAIATLVRLGVEPGCNEKFSSLTRHVSRVRRIRSVCLVDNTFSLAIFMASGSFRSITVFVTGQLSPLRNIISATARFVLGGCGRGKILVTSRPISSEKAISLW